MQTVEQATGLRVDGYAEVGFGGFVSVIDALDGIRMCIPAAIKDRDSHLDLKKGCQTLDGTTALGYVRMRKADPRGDLGRVERQRQMLAAVAAKAASPATVLDPVRYWRLCTATASAVKVGDRTPASTTWARPALAMRTVSAGDGLTLTVPVANPGYSTPVGSAVLWDESGGGGHVRRDRPRRHLQARQVREVAARGQAQRYCPVGSPSDVGSGGSGMVPSGLRSRIFPFSGPRVSTSQAAPVVVQAATEGGSGP